mgnify:FL=1
MNAIGRFKSFTVRFAKADISKSGSALEKNVEF